MNRRMVASTLENMMDEKAKRVFHALVRCFSLTGFWNENEFIGEISSDGLHIASTDPGELIEKKDKVWN